MSPGVRAWSIAAAVVALAVAGEFVGAWRRKVLRREVAGFDPRLVPVGQIPLRLRGADGLPVPQASVLRIDIDGPPGRRTVERTSAGVVAGWMPIAPPAPAPAQTWYEVRDPADAGGTPLPFGPVLVGPLPPGNGPIDVVLPHGRVLEGTFRIGGMARPRVQVKARQILPPELEPYAPADRWDAITPTLDDGRFRLVRLGEGPQVIAFVLPPGNAVAGRRHEGPGPLHVDLPPSGAPVITVTEGKDRCLAMAPVGVDEQAFGTAGVRNPVVLGLTDSNGRIALHGLDPGKVYRLVVGRPGSAPGFGGMQTRWRPSDAAIDFPEQRAVRVTVRDAKRRPLAGVRVRAAPKGNPEAVVEAVTDYNGGVRLQGLDMGPVLVEVIDTSRFPSPGPAKRKELAKYELEASFVLERGPEFRIQIFPYYGNAAVQVLLREAGSGVAAKAEANSHLFTWHSVDPEKTYDVMVLYPAHGLAGRADGVAPGKGNTVVNATATYGMRVDVQWPAGAKSQEVFLAWGSVDAVKGELQPDGSWYLNGIPAGTYVVRARCEIPGDQIKTLETEGPAGGAVKLDLR